MRACPKLPQVPPSHSLYWFFLISVCTSLIFVSGDLVQIRPMRDASLVFRVGRESESKSPCGWTSAQRHRYWVWPYFAQGRSRERQFLGETTEPGQNYVPWFCVGPWLHFILGFPLLCTLTGCIHLLPETKKALPNTFGLYLNHPRPL